MSKTVKDDWGDTAEVWAEPARVFLDITEHWTNAKPVVSGLALTPKQSKKLRKALKAAEKSAEALLA